jgi:hypothetical protein
MPVITPYPVRLTPHHFQVSAKHLVEQKQSLVITKAGRPISKDREHVPHAWISIFFQGRVRFGLYRLEHTTGVDLGSRSPLFPGTQDPIFRRQTSPKEVCVHRSIRPAFMDNYRSASRLSIRTDLRSSATRTAVDILMIPLQNKSKIWVIHLSRTAMYETAIPSQIGVLKGIAKWSSNFHNHERAREKKIELL